MNLLLLGAIQNTKVDVLIEGADADLVLSTLIDIFENQFGDLQYDSSRTG
ncbi:HPr family phosphocarrier protein [Lactococcus petauri]